MKNKGAKIVFLQNVYRYWFSAEGNLKRKIAEEIKSALNGYSLYETDAPGTVGIVPVKTTSGNVVVHFLNYNYDRNAHSFVYSPSFQFSLCYSKMTAESGVYEFQTPEGNIEVEFQKQGNCLKGIVPSFKMWGFINFGNDRE